MNKKKEVKGRKPDRIPNFPEQPMKEIKSNQGRQIIIGTGKNVVRIYVSDDGKFSIDLSQCVLGTLPTINMAKHRMCNSKFAIQEKDIDNLQPPINQRATKAKIMNPKPSQLQDCIAFFTLGILPKKEN